MCYIKRDFYTDAYTILSRDLIKIMNHMRISGTESSSWEIIKDIRVTVFYKNKVFMRDMQNEK